jgi:hypothetical protein
MGREKLILDVDELVEVSELWCTKIKPPTNESHPPVPFQVTWGNHSRGLIRCNPKPYPCICTTVANAYRHGHTASDTLIPHKTIHIPR